MGGAGDALSEGNDLQSTYVNCCRNLPADRTVVVVGSHRVEGASDLFYAPVSVRGQSTLRGMLDSGSMSCTLSVEAESRLGAAGVLPSPLSVPEKVVLISVALEHNPNVSMTWKLSFMGPNSLSQLSLSRGGETSLSLEAMSLGP